MDNKEHKPLVSIITPVFNGVNTMQRTIDSVAAQTYPHIEYIVIDGGSSDGTQKLIDANAARITRWISEKDHGIADAFNKGIAMATGDIIGIINADDWYELNAVEAVVKAFALTNAGVVHGDMRFWKGSRKDYLFYGSDTTLLAEMTVNHPTTFVKRWVYQKYGSFKIHYRYAMDYNLILRFYLKGVPFHYVNQTLANMSLDGVSDTYWRKAYNEVRLAKIDNGISALKANLYFVKQVTRTWVSKKLQNSPLQGIVGWYRRHFSLTKKTV